VCASACITHKENNLFFKKSYMTVWKKENYGDSKKISGCKQFANRWSRKGF
jgi:hypothetical protein